MADKDTPIYDKTRMRGTTWVDATRILFNMGSELEEQVDGISIDQVKQDLADEIINRQNADTQLGNRIDALGTQVNQNKSDITQIKETINQMEDNATALGASVAELQTDVIEAQADIEGIKTSLVSDVITKGGITTGTIVVEIEREDGTKITAEDFNYGKPTSMELLQGSSEGMMKAQFTLSDGTTIQSNDFQVLEMVTGDLYITSFTFKNGSSQGKISADIGLSDGRTLQANDFQLPTDPQVTQNISSLLSRMTAVEEKNSQQDTELSSLDARVKAIEDTPGVGKFELGKLGTIMGSSDKGKIGANADGTGSVNGWDLVVKSDELADYLKKTDAESTYAKKSDVSAIGITTSGNTATVNGKSANIVNSISGQVTDGKLTITVNGVKSGDIPLPESINPLNIGDTWKRITGLSSSSTITNWSDRFGMYAISNGYIYSNIPIRGRIYQQISDLVPRNRHKGYEHTDSNDYITVIEGMLSSIIDDIENGEYIINFYAVESSFSDAVDYTSYSASFNNNSGKISLTDTVSRNNYLLSSSDTSGYFILRELSKI